MDLVFSPVSPSFYVQVFPSCAVTADMVDIELMTLNYYYFCSGYLPVSVAPRARDHRASILIYIWLSTNDEQVT